VRDPQPVEDGEGVDERPPDCLQADGGGEALGDADRELDEVAVAHPAGDDEQFQVKREALLQHRRQDGSQRLAPDQLDPRLGVPDRQPEQRPDQLLVAGRVQPPQRRVDDVRARMALRAQDHVRIARPDRGEELAQLPGRDVAVAVDEPQVAALPLSQAGPQGGSLALVAG
jgi:hypothetical protein